MDSALWPNLFLDQESSDVLLHIYTTSEDRELVVPSHNLILRTAGKSFSAMLDNADIQENQTQKVELQVKGDVSVTFTFLRYLYTKELEEVDLNTYICLLQTAHLYELGDLVMLCEERIERKMTPLTVCRTYNSVRSLATESFKARCKDLMQDSVFLIFWKNLHLSLDEKTMEFLLTSDTLNFLDECQAEGALWRWGNARKAFDSQAEENVEKLIFNLRPLAKKTSTKNLHNDPWWFRNRQKLRFLFGTSASENNRQTGADKGEANDDNETFTIKTEPRSSDLISKFAEKCCFSEASDDIDSVKFLGKRTRLMSISVKRNVLLAGFTIQIEENSPIIDLKARSSAVVSFHLNDNKLMVNDHSKVLISRVDKNTILSELSVTLRTPVLLQKAEVNLLTIDVEPGPNYLNSLTAYLCTNSENNSPNSEKNIPFFDQDEIVAVREFLYFD